MERVNLFLTRFAQLLPPHARVRDVVRQVILEKLELELEPDQVEVRERRVYLRITPLIKNLVFIHREQIVSEIAKRLGEPQARRVS